MKRILTTLLLALPALCFGQNHAFTIDDTAAYTVDRYLRILNIDGLPKDSMLVMETAITTYGSSDTIWMRRWYAWPGKLRVEVINGDKLETGLITNGKDRFRRYLTAYESWESISQTLTG